MPQHNKEKRSQKHGLVVTPNESDQIVLDAFQERFRAANVFQSYSQALTNKRDGLHPLQLKQRLSLRGMSEGDAIEAALESGELVTASLLPYATVSHKGPRRILRLQQVELDTGLSLPGSNVKVADCDGQLNLQHNTVNGFTREQFHELRACYRQLVELRLYAEPGISG